MKLTLTAIGIMLVLHIFTPYWWWIILVPLIIGLAAPSKWSFLRGALASGGVWLLGMVWALLTGASLIAGKVAEVLMVRHTALLILATLILAAMAGGLASVSGKMLRKCIK